MDVSATCRFAIHAARVDLRHTFASRKLGTFANTLGLAVLIALLGTLFGTILKSQVLSYRSYVPNLAAGLIAWMFLASTITESCARVLQWARVLRHTPVPLVAMPASVLLRQLVIFGQNLTFGLLAQLVVFGAVTLRPLPFVGGVILVTVIVLCVAYIGTVLSLRYRNLPQSVAGMLQTAFFMTPLIWPDYFLGRYQDLNDLNPFHHLVVLIRNPLLGLDTPLLTWGCGIGLMIISAALAWTLHRLVRETIGYWL